jgi:hypothetical protein
MFNSAQPKMLPPNILSVINCNARAGPRMVKLDSTALKLNSKFDNY